MSASGEDHGVLAIWCGGASCDKRFFIEKDHRARNCPYCGNFRLAVYEGFRRRNYYDVYPVEETAEKPLDGSEPAG